MALALEAWLNAETLDGLVRIVGSLVFLGSALFTLVKLPNAFTRWVAARERTKMAQAEALVAAARREQQIDKLIEYLPGIAKQLEPNSGGSLWDRVAGLELKTAELSELVRDHITWARGNDKQEVST